MNFDPSVPAYLRDPSIIDGQEAFSGGISSGRGPHITVKNGRFLIVNSADDQKPVPLFDQARGPYFDFVTVDANPGLVKVYFEKGYVDGESGAPDCWSNDGREPDVTIATPVSLSCGTCSMNAFGSAINAATGGKGKACADRKRLAILYVYDFGGPLYEFSVSPSNLKLWNEHVQNLTGRGIPLRGVVTRVYTDASRQGGLLFEAAPNPAGAGLWYVPENLMATVKAACMSEECKKAIGTSGQGGRPLAISNSYVPPMQITQQSQPSSPVIAAPVAQTVQAGPAFSAPMADGAAQTAADPEGSPRRHRRTKAQMEADRRTKEAAQAGSAAPPSNAAPFAAFGGSNSNGTQNAGFGAVPAATPAFTPAPSTSTAFGGAGIRAPESDPLAIPAAFDRRGEQPAAFGVSTPQAAFGPATQPTAAFGVVTNPTPASADVDAMLASVMGR